VFDEPHPGLFQQILGNVPAPREPHKESEHTRIEGCVNLVEGFAISLAQALDQRQFGIPVHSRTNARQWRA
jgi:hypothetical protein